MVNMCWLIPSFRLISLISSRSFNGPCTPAGVPLLVFVYPLALTLDVSMDCLLWISWFGISQLYCVADFYILTASHIHDVI